MDDDDDIREVIESAKENRKAVVEGARTVKEANTINNANHTIIAAHKLDLRKRMFEAEMAGQIDDQARRAGEEGVS